jgi:pSer/pThr/pTyr-binding forkhead associated (FHA) protein
MLFGYLTGFKDSVSPKFMDERHRSDSRNILHSRGDSDTDDIDLSPLHESGMTQTFEGATRDKGSKAYPHAETEADIILIAHPENQRLGSRFRLSPGTTLEIGRSAAVGISLPEVMSISRKHARLRYLGPVVTLEDLGSTNGTYINGQPIHGRTVLRSGDRFQTAAVHFKFLHEQDVESAYHLAIYELVAKDGLTEIFNKRKLEEELQREFARALRHQRPLSLIISTSSRRSTTPTATSAVTSSSSRWPRSPATCCAPSRCWPAPAGMSS